MAPPVRSDAVARPRLAPLHEEVQRSRLVLVSAPAGYGKSTLVAQWSQLDPRPGGWVQLARGDNDPVVLLTRVATALERTGPLGSDLLEELSRRTPRIEEVALPLLAADLSEREPFLLVLDDVHLVTAKRSRSILAFLTEKVRAGSQLVLVTRGDPGMRRGRLRAGGDLSEVGTTLLALDTEETRAVAALGGLELSEKEAEALRERTEGWAAGVVLAALSSRDRDDAAASSAGLAGTQPQIADYLLEEVLGRQPDNLKTFLLGTSILDRMTPPLCDAVLGTDDAADSLEPLARSNAFVVPLDDRGEWYRYHHLFGELLQAELKRRHPELLPVYLARAADWCEQHGTPEEAFAYAHESGDLDQAGRIALKHWDELTANGRIETLRLWLNRCTDKEIESDAQLSIAAAWAAALLGDPVRARRFIAAAERKPLDVPSVDGASSLRSALAIVRCVVAPDGIHGMLRDAEYVYAAEKRESSRWLLSACRALGTANILLGRPQEALDAFGEALALCGSRPELAHIQLYCLSYMAFAATETGDRRHAQTMGEGSAQDGPGSASRRDSPERDRPRGRSAGTPATRRQLRSRPPTRPRPAAPPTAPRGHVARSRPRATVRRDQPRSRRPRRRPRVQARRERRAPGLPRRRNDPQPGSRASENGSAEGRTTSSPRPSSGSSHFCQPISPCRRSPIDSTSPAQPSRPKSRRSTTSSASRPGPKLSRSSTSTTSARPTAGP